jgi:hypothetical protein
MKHKSLKRAPAAFLWLLACVVPATAWCQAPYPGQPMQPGPPPAYQPAPGQQQQEPAKYAFRSDLTNPQYGECLNLERQWQNFWHMYAAEYAKASRMNPRDPVYAQMTYRMQALKRQLDVAWANFSGKCIYFPRPDEMRH